MRKRFGNLGIAVTIGLMTLVLSFWAFRIINNSQGEKLPVLTKDKAVEVALSYLKENSITINILSRDVVLSRGIWHVRFLINPMQKPADVLVTVNPISGEAKLVPLK